MSQLQLASGLPRAANRRASVRYPCRSGISGQVSFAGKYLARRAIVLDLSTGGAALRLSRRVRRGTRLLLELHHPELGFRYTVAVRVAHTQAINASQWLVGCAFARELSHEELKSFIA
jgi:hypothetical protein